MATRFRLPSTGTPAVSPAVQSYTHTGTTRRPLPTTDASALTTTAITPDAADHLVAGDQFHAQFVSNGVVAQTIPSGINVKCAVQCLEAHTNNNLVLQFWVGIYDAAGTTLLATLLAKTVDTLELATTIQNRFLSATTTAGYTCVGGERLVIELSVTGTPGPAAGGVQGHNASLRFGAAGAGGDLPENDTEAGATFNPWFEIAADVFTASVTAGVMTANTAAPTAEMAGASALALTDDLIAYWKLEEASGSRADAHGTATLTDVNTVAQAAGIIGNAALLADANFEALTYSGSNLNLSTTDSFSIQAWVYPTARVDYMTIMADLSAGTRQIMILLDPSGVLYNFAALAAGTVPLNAWSHIVYTFESGGTSTGTERLYVNGTQTGTRTGSVPAPTAGGMEIGRDSSSAAHTWTGRLDEVGFWRRALTPAEVTQLYNSGAGLAYPLVPPVPASVTAGVMSASASSPVAAAPGGTGVTAATGTASAQVPVATVTTGARATAQPGIANASSPVAAVAAGTRALAATGTASANAPVVTVATGARLTAGACAATAAAPVVTITYTGPVIPTGVLGQILFGLVAPASVAGGVAGGAATVVPGVMAATAASSLATVAAGTRSTLSAGTASASALPGVVTAGARQVAEPGAATASLQTATISTGTVPSTVVGAGVMTASATAPTTTVVRGAVLSAGVWSAAATAPVAALTVPLPVTVVGTLGAIWFGQAAPASVSGGRYSAQLAAGVMSGTGEMPIGRLTRSAVRSGVELLAARRRSLLVRAGVPADVTTGRRPLLVRAGLPADAEYDL